MDKAGLSSLERGDGDVGSGPSSSLVKRKGFPGSAAGDAAARSRAARTTHRCSLTNEAASRTLEAVAKHAQYRCEGAELVRCSSCGRECCLDCLHGISLEIQRRVGRVSAGWTPADNGDEDQDLSKLEIALSAGDPIMHLLRFFDGGEEGAFSWDDGCIWCRDMELVHPVIAIIPFPDQIGSTLLDEGIIVNATAGPVRRL